MEQVMDELNRNDGLRAKLRQELEIEDREQAAFDRGLQTARLHGIRGRRNLTVQEAVRLATRRA